jgi:hypothetical protein
VGGGIYALDQYHRSDENLLKIPSGTNNKIAWRLGSAEGVEHLSGQRGEQKWARVQVRRED